MSRYVDAEWLNECFPDAGEGDWTYNRTAQGYIDSAPSIDIVRCQDCKHWVYNFNGCSRNPCTEPWLAEDFCSYGERRE